ncbi:MAG: hypothetical protein WA647_19105 [Candidatus Acidiferrum sp.]
MSAAFQPVPFQLGELGLKLTAKFTREDFVWLAGMMPDKPRSNKELARLGYRLIELLFRCARENSPELTMEDVFGEFGADPKGYASALAIALTTLACTTLENRGQTCQMN